MAKKSKSSSGRGDAEPPTTSDKTSPAANAMNESPRTQGSAVGGASLLIALQFFSRAVTFVANQLLLRFLTATLLGVSAQLEVYYLSIVFFARESLRVALQRQGSTAEGSKEDDSNEAARVAADSQAVVNIAHVALVLGLGAAGGFGWSYLHYVDGDTASTPYLGLAVQVYAVAALVELLSEPAFVVLQHRLRFGPRAAAESIATFLRCVFTFGAAQWAWRSGVDIGALPFAIGQLAYGVGLLAVYTWFGSRLASSEGFSLLPRKAVVAPRARASPPDTRYMLGYFYKPTLQLATNLSAQSLVKHILTQGDTFLVSALSDTESQGVYALASSYGSLLARLVFQPIEESSRNYFSKLLSSSGDSAAAPRKSLEKARADFQALLRFYVLLSVVILTLGPFGAPLLVQLIAGAKWAASGAGGVLAVYCGYIPLLAINGVAEAFVSSVATKAEIRTQSLWMGAFSLAFGLAGVVFLRVLNWGAVGLVYANVINMSCRIVWSGVFIPSYFGRQGVEFKWTSIAPSGLAVYVVAAAVIWPALTRLGVSVGAVSPNVFKDIIMVAAVAVPYVAIVAVAERRYLMDCYQSLRGRRAAATP